MPILGGKCPSCQHISVIQRDLQPGDTASVLCPRCETSFRVTFPPHEGAEYPRQEMPDGSWVEDRSLPPEVLARWRARNHPPTVLFDVVLVSDDIKDAEQG